MYLEMTLEEKSKLQVLDSTVNQSSNNLKFDESLKIILTTSTEAEGAFFYPSLF